MKEFLFHNKVFNYLFFGKMDVTSLYFQQQTALDNAQNGVNSLAAGGLRRVRMPNLKEDLDNNCVAKDEESLNSASIYFGTTPKVENLDNLVGNIINNMEEQKQQLFGICEMIQVKVNFVLKFKKIVY